MPNPFQKAIQRIFLEVGVLLDGVEAGVSSRTLPQFATDPRGLVIDRPREIAHPERIYIGHDVKIGPNSVLRAKVRNPGSWLRHPTGDHVEQTFDSEVFIGNRVTATSGLQVHAFRSIRIEEDVMFAHNVFVSDGTHATSTGDRPYKYQGIERIEPIVIRTGAWIGQNVVILPGVTIGRFAVIGANSVVTKSVPDGSIAMGTPARVVRRWNGSEWQEVQQSWAQTPLAHAGRDEADGVSGEDPSAR